MDKKQAREIGRTARKEIAAEDRALLDSELFKQAIDLLPSCHTIGCYVSLKEEAGTALIIDWCLKHRIAAALPVVIGDELQFRELQRKEDLVKDRFGIYVPSNGRLVLPEEMDLIFVPLTSFDDKGNRTGFGRGYYDRYLSRCRMKIGLAYACQKVDQIETDADDIRLDMIMTPTQQFCVYRKNDL